MEADDNIEAVADLIRLYEDGFNNCAGGSLHITLADGNTDDSSVRFCINWAKEHTDHLGVALGELLLAMTEENRISTINLSRQLDPSWGGGLIGEDEDDEPATGLTATGSLVRLD